MPLQEMHLVLRDFQPQELVQVEKNGTRIRMYITTFTRNPEISETLYIAGGTVKNHLSNILGKLGVRDRTQAALKARELGLL